VVAKQTCGKAGSPPVSSQGDDVAPGVVPHITGVNDDESTGVTGLVEHTSGKAGSTPECPEGNDVATGVVTRIKGIAGSTPGEQDAGGKPSCIPPSQGGRARPPDVSGDDEATVVGKQTSGRAGPTPVCPGSEDEATGVVTHIDGNPGSTPEPTGCSQSSGNNVKK